MHSTIKLMMREIIGQGLGAIMACCSTKWKVVLNIYVYTHRLIDYYCFWSWLEKLLFTLCSNLCWDLKLIKVLRISSYWVLDPKWYIWINILRLREPCRNGDEENQDPEDERKCNETSSRCDTDVASTNSRQLWLSAQDLHKVKPVHTAVWVRRDLMRTHL